MYDLVIRDAALVDGSGAPRVHGDLAIADGRIAELGATGLSGRRVIDAGGRIVCPGFVDVHTHYDVQAFWDPTLSPSPLHGVTTVLGGNCGFSAAPCDAETARYLMHMLARVEGMPLQSLESGAPWDWRSTADFLGRLDGRLAVNAGFMVGHSALRRLVMGEDANAREATAAEVAAMRAQLVAGIEAGGLGFSSTWSASHYDGDGNPVPSRFASSEELVALASTCRDFPGTSLEFLPRVPAVPGAFDEETQATMLQMSAGAGRPLNWNVMIVDADNLDDWLLKLELSTRARTRGAKIVGLAITRMSDPRRTFLTGVGFDSLPGWEHAMTCPVEERVRIFADPAERARLARCAAEPADGRPPVRWDTVVIEESASAAGAGLVGRRVGEIAAARGQSAFDALVDLCLTDALRTVFVLPRGTDGHRHWEARARIWTDDRVVVGGSDAGAHLHNLATFNYTTLLLEQGVRRHRLLSLEAGIRLLTDVPARLYGLVDRGRLAVGAWGDLVLFDEEAVAPLPCRMVQDLPAGGARLYGGAVGIDRVLVAGREIVVDGELTEERPGQVLRSGRDTRDPEMH